MNRIFFLILICAALYTDAQDKIILTIPAARGATGATLTAAQRDAAVWISLWNAGATNTATNKIDSTLNYIK